VTAREVPDIGIPRTINGPVTEQNGVGAYEHCGDDLMATAEVLRSHAPSLPHDEPSGGREQKTLEGRLRLRSLNERLAGCRLIGAG
jgi:hypothetical protein